MKDNILIFTEDHISPNLLELAGYFSGCLKLDGRDFRERLIRVHEWYSELLRRDVELQHLTRLLGEEPGKDPRLHLNRPGYMTFISGRPTYDPARLLPPARIQVWESLLVKLKEFELFNALRRSIVGVERDGDHVLGRERFSTRVGIGASTTPLRLSSSTRPLDFMAPWVVDPLVARFGLIYDISDFTETVSLLRRSGALEQDRSFRMMFRFQRKVNRLAFQHKAKLEKYLGDGAFYSSRDAHHLLVLAMHIQRAYREALAKGFPFSNGLRIALNHGQYRLLPIQIGGKEEGGDRYEFFGHGVVELTRLTSGQGLARDRRDQDAAHHPGLPRTGREPLLRADDAPEPRRGEQGRGVAQLLLLHQPQRFAGERGHRRHARLHPAPGEGVASATGSSACSTANAPTSRSRWIRRTAACSSASASSASRISRASTGCRSTRSWTLRCGETTPWSSCAAASWR